MAPHRADFFPVIVRTDHHPETAALLRRPDLRITRADQIKAGDLILSGFDTCGPDTRLPATDYFAGGAYPANPEKHDPTCGCGVCGLEEFPGGTVVLTTGFPWDTCDPWAADALVLILPFYDPNPFTFVELKTVARGEYVPRRYDTWSVESFRHYLATGTYLPADTRTSASVQHYIETGAYLPATDRDQT
ncbi:hypothetical protein [Kitasatospora sp. NPDC088548]|uniref:hypothetical protein n=1 Tax=Kitasatospora sp. NPDC088548 TaxID=3364075 RepID=UPI00382AFE93